MQMSGGHLLPPVQTLEATIYFCKAKMAIESGHRHHVGASFVSLAPLPLLFSRDPLALGSRPMMSVVRI